ncbi:hypothetical protein [Streptomyces inhibens]|uniref:hypothetical protein n=1 Tax=Streptomyces inhibens TaxID=2293571 RepID=UPI001EE6ABD8|nr:hypothetical protein [Streptomyces inhibens]UKY49871.1 hypothetical protein KI385_14290 [Streptomyces inhibens]
MQPEVIAAYIGGGGALVGVILGIVGTLGAARIQAHGAHAQADAARSAADAQTAATHTEWRRTQQRAAYGDLMRAAARVAHAVERKNSDADAIAAALREVNDALALVDLEGPSSLRPLAQRVDRCCAAAVRATTGPVAPLTRALADLAENITPELLAELLDTLTLRVDHMSPVREYLRVPPTHGNTGPQGLDPELLPVAAPVAEAAQVAETEARDLMRRRPRRSAFEFHDDVIGLARSFEARGILSPWQAYVFVLETFSPNQNNALRRAHAVEQLDDARGRFAEAARAYLDTPPPVTLNGDQGQAAARDVTRSTD